MKNSTILTLMILIIVGGSIYYLMPQKSVDDEIFACTMDALICPDGSGVGRSGPACTFDACQSQGPFEGELREDSDGLVLVMDSFDSNGTSYILPIVDIRAVNNIGDFTGKRVRVNGSFREGHNLVASMIEEISSESSNTSAVKIGETKTINGLKITLNEVVGDYRCPIDVQCIQAGAITANVTLESSTKKETKNMASDEVPMDFENYKISIVDVNPPLVSTIPADPKAYVVTFRVEK